ncbi:MAG TPA: Npt1/Npt2 family nucleotide transporter [Vicinamibacterales bacterium]|nr:Npt1/Npt2 family nucleotide transporter [Vicinamibacterales bacterium]
MLFRLRRFFDVRAGEGLPVLLSFLYVACVVAAFLLAKPLRNSLFLREYGPYALVYAYVAVPLVLWAFVPAFNAAAARVGTRIATAGTLLFFSLNVVGFWWAFRAGAWDLLPAAFYVWVNCFGVIAPVQAWSFANSLFDARQARRLFGLIGAGASLGAIAGGVLARFLVAPVGGTVNLLLVLAALIFAAALIVGFASRRLTRRQAAQKRRRAPLPFAQTLRTIGSRPYLRLLAALVVLVAIVTQWVAFQLSLVAAERFGDDADALTRFFGEFNFTLGSLAFVLQLLLTARVLRLFGVGAVILLLPAALALGSALTVLLPVFLAVLLTNAADQSLRFSLDKAAYELLYLPLPPGERPAIKNALDIIANRAGDAVGGVLLGIMTGGFLMLPGAGFGLRGTAAVTCVLALLWLAVAWRLRRAYVGVIGESIHRYRVDTERAQRALGGPSLHERVSADLASSDPAVVRQALDVLRTTKAPRAYPELYWLLGHAQPDIRRDALAVLAASGDRTARSTAETLLHDSDLGVRTQALLYLARDGSFDPLRRIQQLGDFEDFSIRAAMVAFLAAPGRSHNEEAAHVLLQQMADSEEPRDRVEAARVLALLESPPLDVLARLIADADPDVARQALRSAQTRRATGCFEPLLGALARPDLAEDAIAALAALGQQAVPLLEAGLAEPALPLETRREIPSVLVRIGTPEAERALLAGLMDADAPLRHRVIASLNKLKQRHPQMTVDRTAVELLLAAEIAGHYRSYQVLLPLGKDDRMAAALRESMEQELERIFRLIALLSPAGALHDAYVGIRSENELIRANALEYLDNVLRPELRDVLLPLIDTHVSDAERAAIAEKLLGAPRASADDAVAALLASGDPWLRSRVELAYQRMTEGTAGEADHTPAPASIRDNIGAG